METSLHRELKHLYAASPDSVEVAESRYRIDAIDAKGRLVEIQHAGLGALRRKITQLLDADHQIRIIKPWIELIKCRLSVRTSTDICVPTLHLC